MMGTFSEWFAENGKMSAISRASILMFAIVGVVTAPIVAWFTKNIWEEFRDQTATLSKIERYMGEEKIRDEGRDSRIAELQGTSKETLRILNDHERRIFSIERMGRAND